jgi:hypothetical protein
MPPRTPSRRPVPPAPPGATGGAVTPHAVRIPGYGWLAVWEGGKQGPFKTEESALKVAAGR